MATLTKKQLSTLVTKTQLSTLTIIHELINSGISHEELILKVKNAMASLISGVEQDAE